MAGGGQGAGSLRGFADGGMTQTGYNNYASPNQGQPPVLSQSTPQVMNNGGPNLGASYAGNNMGFDNSGSDGGVGGQPTQMQNPLQRTFADGGFAQPQAGLASLGSMSWGGQQAPASGSGQAAWGSGQQNVAQGGFGQPATTQANPMQNALQNMNQQSTMQQANQPQGSFGYLGNTLQNMGQQFNQPQFNNPYASQLDALNKQMMTQAGAAPVMDASSRQQIEQVGAQMRNAAAADECSASSLPAAVRSV
jgi:hypothetical protein